MLGLTDILDSDLRFDSLEKQIDAISSDLASNLTEINTNLELLESQSDVAVSSDITELKQKFNELESVELPKLRKERIEMKINP